jgi:Uma2 family endonuclease
MLKPLETKQIVYPEADGEPMAETGFHVIVMMMLIAMLRSHFRDRADIYVNGNMFMYYEEDEPSQHVAPDVFVAFNVPQGERRSWFVWREGKAPDVVFEITSRSTRANDQGSKKGLYEWLGVKEYFLFDPLGDYLHPALQGYYLNQDRYQPIEKTDGWLVSEELGLRLRNEGNVLDLMNLKTGERLLPPEEMAAAFQSQATILAEKAADLESANAEIARLTEELARLRKGDAR